MTIRISPEVHLDDLLVRIPWENSLELLPFGFILNLCEHGILETLQLDPAHPIRVGDLIEAFAIFLVIYDITYRIIELIVKFVTQT